MSTQGSNWDQGNTWPRRNLIQGTRGRQSDVLATGPQEQVSFDSVKLYIDSLQH